MRSRTSSSSVFGRDASGCALGLRSCRTPGSPTCGVSPSRYSVGLEPGFPEAIAQGLAERGHSVRYVEQEHVFGGAQLILKTEHGYVAGSDHRKEGQAAGF